MLYQHITTYSFAIKCTRLIPGNVCVQAEGMLKPMETLVLIQDLVWVESIQLKKTVKLSAPITRGKLH